MGGGTQPFEDFRHKAVKDLLLVPQIILRDAPSVMHQMCTAGKVAGTSGFACTGKQQSSVVGMVVCLSGDLNASSRVCVV